MRCLWMVGLAAALVVCSGCSSMLERSHVTATAHVEHYTVAEGDDTLKVESYQGLVNAILYCVEQHLEAESIRLYNYTGDVESDLARACEEVRQEDPLGGYAVEELGYEVTRILTYYEVRLTVDYRYTAEELERLHRVQGSAGLRQELERMVGSFEEEGAILLSYYAGTLEEIEELFWSVYYSTPLSAVPTPQVVLTAFPESGRQRIITVSVEWPQSKEELVNRAAQLEAAANQTLEGYAPGRESYTLEELVELASQWAANAADGSADPAKLLEGEGVNQLGYLLTLELLCQQTGWETMMVLGTRDSEWVLWLMVHTAEGYRHLLLPQGQGELLPLYTDYQLLELGYSWDTDLYPACPDGIE